jgi:protein ImuB
MFIVEAQCGRQIVVDCDPKAQRAGVQLGMTLAHARALLPMDARVEDHAPLRDQQTLTALGRWAMRFTPVVAPDPPDGLLLDVTGCTHLFGGAQAMVRSLIDQVRRLGFTPWCALSPTIGASWALARFGSRSPIAINRDELTDALHPLPVQALRIDEPTVTALQRVGIYRIEELLKMSRASLHARFGETLLLRIDQAVGEAFEMLQPLRPPMPVQASQAFDGPVKQLEAIQQTARMLLDALAEQLQQREAGVLRLVLEVMRVDATDLSESLSLSRPTRDSRHLWKLLAPRIEKLNLGYGIDQLTVHAARTAPLPHTQTTTGTDEAWEDHERLDRSIAALVDQLSERLGPQRVQRVTPVATHVPERAFAYQSVQHGERADAAPFTNAGHVAGGPSMPDRPAQLFDRVVRVDVVLRAPDGPVVSMQCRGDIHRIVTSIGPERITPRWWLTPPDRTPRPRDYFKVQDADGRWYWLYRKAGTSKWFMHGLWC